MIRKTTAVMSAIPLRIAEWSGDKVQGKTRMQKLVYIIQKRANEAGIHELNYEYEPYHYGPFSLKLCFILDDLIAEGHLKHSIGETKAGNPLHIYELTDKGIRHFYDLHSSEPALKKIDSILQKVVEEYGSKPLQELVDHAYAEMENGRINTKL